MQRLFASLLFCAAAAFATAQSRNITVTDTDAMRASAQKHTTLVDQAVSLDAEQKTKVNEIYMNYERRLEGMNQRFAMANMTKEQRDAEMGPQWASLDRTLNEQLGQVLSTEQLAKWQEANK